MAEHSTTRYNALVPQTMAELMELAEKISKSNIIPREYIGKPGDILVAMSMGMEIGLKPVQALQSIAVINGRPSLWGDSARGLIMASGQLESITETDPNELRKTQVARCEIVRRGFDQPFVGEFSIEDARKAGLAGKDTYTKYGSAMLTWRAFHQAARKAFPDLYRGLAAAEEMEGVEPKRGEGKVEIVLDPPKALDAPTEPEKRETTTFSPAAAPAKRGRPVRPAAASEPPPAEACGLCGKTGHGFNDCPTATSAAEPSKAVEPEVVKRPAKVSPEGARALVAEATRKLGHGDGVLWLKGRFTELGIAVSKDLTPEQCDTLLQALLEFPEPEAIEV